jgi:shikimate 5-dehydrogenase
MLIGQALGQFSRWTGLEAPGPLMYRAALDRLGMTRLE